MEFSCPRRSGVTDHSHCTAPHCAKSSCPPSSAHLMSVSRARQVERQREALIAAIEADGGTRPEEAGAFSVLQYNAPYTVPWRRRNELAIVVTEAAAGDTAAEVDDGAAVTS